MTDSVGYSLTDCEPTDAIPRRQDPGAAHFVIDIFQAERTFAGVLSG